MSVTFLVAHGAWSAGWAWKKMHPLMQAAGHRLVTPTYTGLGERAHLAAPSIDLDTHIQDMLGVLEFEDLRDVVLIGHSYGGMVATGVAARVPERIRRLVYLDAFVPRDGQSLFDLVGPAGREAMRSRAEDGWRVPPNPTPGDTSAEDLAWLTPRRVAQPLRCFETPVRLPQGESGMPRDYIYCTRIGPTDTFRPFADRARAEAGWGYHEMDASHSPHVTAPEGLMRVLMGVVG
jgi:pimeloyl-ACP methyl ester carboxylesterase